MQKFFIAVFFAALVVVQAQAVELEEMSEKPIPNQPAVGKVIGREFKVVNAKLEDGSLKLWQGEGFNSLEQFQVDLSGKAVENFSEKTFTVKLDESPGIEVTLAYTVKKGSIETSTHLRKYTMRLEFGTAKDGKIPGKIHLRLPDDAGSFVVGTFVAKIN
jgi:hypothetical protein